MEIEVDQKINFRAIVDMSISLKSLILFPVSLSKFSIDFQPTASTASKSEDIV